MQLREFVISARKVLSHLYPSDEVASIVGRLCCECFGVDNYAHIISPSLELDPLSAGRADAMLSRIAEGEPLQYVLGYADFYGRRFNVNQSVLIPRPETEVLCRGAAEYAASVIATGLCGKRKFRVLDLCTGSGCIAWTLALEVPGVEVVAVDISQDAIVVASSQPFGGEVSTATAGGTVAPRFVCADIFDDEVLSSALGTDGFDLVLSNPPYIRESEKSVMHGNVLDFEPFLALFVPDRDPMVFNRKIAEICKKYLYTGAVGFVEINERLGDAAKGVFETYGMQRVTVLKDLSGRDRFVKFHKP